MKTITCALLFLMVTSLNHHLAAGTIEEDFANPPADAKPMVWWHWMGHYVSKEGITKDLEAMKAAGISGATIFNLASSVQAGSVPLKNTPWPENDYRSPAWWALVEHAAKEADRLGLNLGMHNCVGYSATGGPWITPEKSMKRVVWTTTTIKGGTSFAGPLPQPKANYDFYRDIGVIAIPDGAEIPQQSVLDLSAQMSPDGSLKWDAPEGSWVVYRFGYTSTGATCAPAPEEVKTLECDKLSAADSKFHYEQVLQPLKEHLGPLLGKSMKHLTLDSYEAGDLNWTESFREEFKKRRGYDPVVWLPTLDKRVIGNTDLTARFTWDFKTTISDLFIQNNFRQGKAMMNAEGVRMYLEPYSGPFSTVESSSVPDMAMGEFWLDSSGGIGRTIVGAAQAAGNRIIGAEAFTARPNDGNWAEAPSRLKMCGDGAWASGVNQLFLHHWVHQPFGDNLKPGMGMGWWGTHFGRNQTWYEPGKAWIAYLGRSQALLQRGEAVSDYLVMNEAGNNRSDAIAERDLVLQVVMKDGRFTLPSGRSYAILQVPNKMLPSTARKIKEWVAEGGVVMGQRPEHSPSLQDYPKADEEVAAIGRELWGETVELERSYGKGKIYTKSDQAFAALNLGDDFSVQPNKTKLRYFHRLDGNTDIYFVTSHESEPSSCTISLRTTGKIPELWDSEHGTRRIAPVWRIQNGRTELDLNLQANASFFVILRKPTSETASAPLPAIKPASAPLKVEGQWVVNFGKEQKISMPVLTSWSKSEVPAVKYFSGTAVYCKTIDVPSGWINKDYDVRLDLGTVKEIARVKINGVDCGVAWHSPFLVDVGNALKVGRNTLEIEVTNTWTNRLIGDEQEPDDVPYTEPVKQGFFKDKDNNPYFVGRRMIEIPDWILQKKDRPTKRQGFCTWNYFTKDSPLPDSGLLGPVQLVSHDKNY